MGTVMLCLATDLHLHNNYDISNYSVTAIECGVAPLFLQVADSRGHTLFRKEDASKGRFAFTTEDYELFEVCFLSTVTGKTDVHVSNSIRWANVLLLLCSEK